MPEENNHKMDEKELKQARRFRRMGLITIAAVLFLIWVGSMVRAMDAGMGCPDWPTCFGQWVPPTDVQQLPENYKEIYADRGYAKEDFDPVKTWIEYINRLTGTTIGFLIFLTLIFALPYRKTDKPVFYLTVLAFILVGFNGWLGSVVVSSNLHPAMITTHMLMSLILVGVLILAITSSQRHLISMDASVAKSLKPLILITLGLTLIQVAIGTQVREQVDQIAAHAFDYYHREGWIAQIGSILKIHILSALIVVAINSWLVMRIKAACQKPLVQKGANALLVILFATFALGLTLYIFDLPHLVQPLHLLFASLLFSVQMFLYAAVHYSDKTENTAQNLPS
jgi:cytochrome c oxidase assembly protein subunit 15